MIRQERLRTGSSSCYCGEYSLRNGSRLFSGVSQGSLEGVLLRKSTILSLQTFKDSVESWTSLSLIMQSEPVQLKQAMRYRVEQYRQSAKISDDQWIPIACQLDKFYQNMITDCQWLSEDRPKLAELVVLFRNDNTKKSSDPRYPYLYGVRICLEHSHQSPGCIWNSHYYSLKVSIYRNLMLNIPI